MVSKRMLIREYVYVCVSVTRKKLVFEKPHNLRTKQKIASNYTSERETDERRREKPGFRKLNSYTYTVVCVLKCVYERSSLTTKEREREEGKINYSVKVYEVRPKAVVGLALLRSM